MKYLIIIFVFIVSQELFLKFEQNDIRDTINPLMLCNEIEHITVYEKANHKFAEIKFKNDDKKLCIDGRFFFLIKKEMVKEFKKRNLSCGYYNSIYRE